MPADSRLLSELHKDDAVREAVGWHSRVGGQLGVQAACQARY